MGPPSQTLFPEGEPASALAGPLPCPGLFFRSFSTQQGFQKKGRLRECLLRIQLPREANKVVPFWNAKLPSGTWVEISIDLLSGGKRIKIPMARWDGLSRNTSYPRLNTKNFMRDVDTLHLKQRTGKLNLRLKLHSHKGRYPRLSLAGLTWAGKTAPHKSPDRLPHISLACPAISQFEAPLGLAPRLCSPASLAMALSSQLDETVSLMETARKIYDPGSGLYGNWSFAVAYAGQRLNQSHPFFGAALCFMSGWSDCIPFLKKKIPIVLSLKFGHGRLPGSPIPKTPGHLVLLRGFTKKGMALVHDPAGQTSITVPCVYSANALGRAWAASGRLAYVLIRGKAENLLRERLGKLRSGPFG